MPTHPIPRTLIDAATPGLTSLASSVFGGKKTYQDAYDKEQLNQSRIAQLAGLQAQQEAQARHFDAQAAEVQSKTDMRKSRPVMYEEQVANSSGFDIPTVQAYRQKLAGVSPQVPMGPPTEMGDMGVGTFQVGPETRSKLSLAIQQHLPLLSNTGDLKPDDLAQAAKGYHDIGLQDDVLAGRRTAADVNASQRAIKGADLFKQTATGSVLNPATGEVDQTSPIAQSTVAVKTAQAAKASQSPAPRGKQPVEIDRDRVGILSQELNKTREGMKTATGSELVRLQADEAALVAELKNAGIKDLGQLAMVKPGKSAKPDAVTQKVADAQDVLTLLDQAEPLLNDTTNSYAGHAIDQAARTFGYSTTGAQAAARLKAIEGLLVSKMPKMSGPQSDRDVLLYRQMAGQVGDPTLPLKTRQAALDTIRIINRLYAAGGHAQQPDAIPTISDDAQYHALPSGAQYRSPDGHVRRKL